MVASAAGVAAAIAIFAAPNLELSNLSIGATGLVNAAAALELFKRLLKEFVVLG